MKETDVKKGAKVGLLCPQCSEPLPDYALSCKNCGADLHHTELRTVETLNKSINRNEKTIFFNVSPLKLFVMSLVTFSLYEIYWSYKNWTYVNEHTDRKFFPMLNALFCTLNSWGLMNEMGKAGAEAGKVKRFPAVILAVLYFLSALTSRAPGWFTYIGLLGCLCLIPAQRYINEINRENQMPINDKFSVANWVAIVIGGGLQILALIGMCNP